MRTSFAERHDERFVTVKTITIGGVDAETVWGRHSNPKSGWSRLLSWPVFVVALYYRKGWLMVVTVLFLVVNPVLFREPVGEPDDWMYKVVQAEQRWLGDGHRLLGLGYPQVLNTLSVPVMLYGLYAAYKQKPVSTTVFTLASQVLNQWCMKVIVDHYEDVDSGHQGGADEF
jgi:hypothetical protein